MGFGDFSPGEEFLERLPVNNTLCGGFAELRVDFLLCAEAGQIFAASSDHMRAPSRK